LATGFAIKNECRFSGQLVEYLEKENRLKPEEKAELWFNQQRDDLPAQEVRLYVVSQKWTDAAGLPEQ